MTNLCKITLIGDLAKTKIRIFSFDCVENKRNIVNDGVQPINEILAEPDTHSEGWLAVIFVEVHLFVECPGIYLEILYPVIDLRI